VFRLSALSFFALRLIVTRRLLRKHAID